MNSFIHPKSTKGFTIIEFLVASTLAIIVIIAAGSTYFITRNLGYSIQQRLKVQQNLRSATTLLMRDARMAGSFGCYNTSSSLDGRLAPEFESNIPNDLFLGSNPKNNNPDNTPDNQYGIRKDTLTDSKTGTSLPNALIFIYGLNDSSVTNVKAQNDDLANVKTNISVLTGMTLASQDDKNQTALDPLRQSLKEGGNVVLSSCRAAYGFKVNGTTSDNISLGNLQTYLRSADLGELTLSQLYAVAYAVNPEHQLIRVDTNAQGEWNSPQIVAEGINNMEVGFAYTDNCPINELTGAASGTAPETFTFVSDIATTPDKKQLPSLVQVRLNYDIDVDNREGVNKTISPSATPETATYIINATVRGGNTCGNRVPVK